MKLEEFIIKAKQYCYHNPAIIKKDELGCFVKYNEENYSYTIRYDGGINYASQELVYFENKPIWVMNYICQVVSDGFNGEFLFELLKTEKSPFRGPLLYEKSGFKYLNNIEGQLDWFNGNEEIYYNDILIYRGQYNGGLII